jgi:photosynthetic reaction center H subunit
MIDEREANDAPRANVEPGVDTDRSANAPPRANDEPSARVEPRPAAVVPLSELSDYEVAEQNFDVRGWDVLAGGGERIGAVTDLLVDVTKLKVRYVAVRLDVKPEARHVLVPIGLTKLDGARRAVLVDSLSQAVMWALPKYEGGELSREAENTLRASLQAAIPAADFYEHPHFDDARFYGDYRPADRAVLQRRGTLSGQAPPLNDQAPPLSRLKNVDDFEIAPGSPDIRGWKIVGAEGTKIGTVQDLLVDLAAKKVRYLEIDVVEDIKGIERTLLPVGLAIIDREDKIVFIPEVSATTLGRLPAYRGEPVDRAYERALLQAIPPRYGAPVSTGAFYDHRYFEDRR